jgi:3-phenylpropionate/cinnamic acid dioxygenase small subunit
MDDGEQIRALIHAYAERLDTGDLDGLAELFADSTWRSQGRTEVFRGVEQVRKMYRGVILYDGRPCTKHVITNVSVVANGSDVATARSYFTVLQATPELPLQPIIAGSYHDEFSRVDGTWRFSDRMIIVDLVGDLSRHMRSSEARPQRT